MNVQIEPYWTFWVAFPLERSHLRFYGQESVAVSYSQIAEQLSFPEAESDSPAVP